LSVLLMWKLIHIVLYFISLVIMGNSTEFERAVLWLSENLTFDVDARINLFEVNISTWFEILESRVLCDMMSVCSNFEKGIA